MMSAMGTRVAGAWDGRDAAHVLCLPGTKALLPGFCLERTCQAHSHWELVCAFADTSVTGCRCERQRVEGSKLIQSGQGIKIKLEIEILQNQVSKLIAEKTT